MNSLQNNFSTKLYAIFFHIALSTTVFQLICPFYSGIRFFRPDYMCMAAMCIILLINAFRQGIGASLAVITETIKKNKVLFILCVVYFIWDTVTVAYAKDPYFLLDKYLIWAKIGIVCFLMLYYVNPKNTYQTIKNRINGILWNLGLTSCAVSIIAYIGYYTKTFTYYNNMITTISDHNVFSSGIMFGFICLCHVILFNERFNIITKLAVLGVSIVVCVPAMYLSASRRTIILLWAFLAWFTVYTLYYIFTKTDKKQWIKAVVIMLVIAAVSWALCGAHFNFFNDYYQHQKEQAEETPQNNPPINTDSDNDNQDATTQGEEVQSEDDYTGPTVDYYVDTISNGSGLYVRKLIWDATLQWYNEMSPVEKLIGGGATYHYDIFNDLDDPKNYHVVLHYGTYIKEDMTRWMYPHNFILEELMMGGIVKVLIVAAIMIEVLRRIFLAIKNGDREHNILLLSLYATLLGNLIMGGKFGLFGNRYTWLIVVLDIAIKYMSKQEDKDAV